jgi:hypothetical protein
MMQSEYCSHHAAEVVGTVRKAGGGVRCQSAGCNKTASFGFKKGERPLYCKTCMPADLKDKLISIRRAFCEGDGCNISATFGFLEDRVSAHAIMMTAVL